MYIQKTANCKVAPAYQKYKKRWKRKNTKKNTNYKEEES